MITATVPSFPSYLTKVWGPVLLVFILPFSLCFRRTMSPGEKMNLTSKEARSVRRWYYSSIFLSYAFCLTLTS